MDVLELLRRYCESGRLGDVRSGRLPEDGREVVMFAGDGYAFDGAAPSSVKDISVAGLVLFAECMFRAEAEEDDEGAEREAAPDVRMSRVRERTKAAMQGYRSEACVPPPHPDPPAPHAPRSPRAAADPARAETNERARARAASRGA